MEERLLRQVREATYLTTTNADRYRVINRYLYEQHKRVRLFIDPEEIYSYMKSLSYFHDYDREDLEQDLQKLVNWNNLVYQQDTSKARSIEEMKKKRYKYQPTLYTIELEGAVKEIEKKEKQGYQGSLRKTLFDRFVQNIFEVSKRNKETGLYVIEKWKPEKVHQKWLDINQDFQNMVLQASDYLAYVKSKKVQDLMIAAELLEFREKLTDYLHDFFIHLLSSIWKVEPRLQEIEKAFVQLLIEKLVIFELSIPRDPTPTHEQLEKQIRNQWDDMVNWFLDRENGGLIYLLEETDQVIRNIVRFCQLLSETSSNVHNRKTEYLTLANWFLEAESDKEAREIAAFAFCTIRPQFLFVSNSKQTDYTEVEVWEEPPAEVILQPCKRGPREKKRSKPINSYKNQREELLQEREKQMEIEKRLIKNLTQKSQLTLSDLHHLSRFERKIILNWIVDCIRSSNKNTKVDTALWVQLEQLDNKWIEIVCEDGLMKMLNVRLNFYQKR